jgi:hypothetical protein
MHSERLADNLRFVVDATDDYLAREAKARMSIDRQLAAAGWVVQHADLANVAAGPGVAVREFILEKGHGRVDYLLFVDGQPTAVIEDKPEGPPWSEQMTDFSFLKPTERLLGAPPIPYRGLHMQTRHAGVSGRDLARRVQ